MIESTLTALTAGIAGVGGLGAEPSFWLPEQASTASHHVDRLFYFILGISVVFFVLVVALMTLFVVRYRRRHGAQAASSPSHNTALEITWTVIPVVIVVAIFVLGFRGFLDMATPPANAYEIHVEGQKWSWSFTYPNGHVDADLHAPVGRPVRLIMSSRDVIHSLYVPAFRIKNDVVPGRYSQTWFEATRPGEFDLFCAEYCGASHSDMLARVVIHPPGEFERWLAEASDLLATMSPAEAGGALFVTRGCMQCHSVDGSAKIGPSMQGVFGRRAATAGGLVLADETYIRRSILEPMADVVAGYDPVMPTYQGRLKDDEITAIVEYLKTLSNPTGSE